MQEVRLPDGQVKNAKAARAFSKGGNIDYTVIDLDGMGLKLLHDKGYMNLPAFADKAAECYELMMIT